MGKLRTRASSRMTGFTMIELITVMVIAGILAAFAAPRFFNRNVFDSRGFADQVLASLRYAQKEAIAQHRFVCVAFTANSVTLHTGTDSLCTANLPVGSINLTGPTGAAPYSVSSSNASFTATPATFNFDALGKPSAATSQSITINGYATPITVEAETGYVH